MKIYDLGHPSAEPEKFQAADSIRFVSYHQNDSVILSTYVDKPNIRYSLLHTSLHSAADSVPLASTSPLSLELKSLYPTHALICQVR